MMRIELIGNLGADAEARYNDNGLPLATFDIAINQRKRDQNGEKVERTDWFRVRLVGNRAAYASLFKKGQRVLVYGRLDIGEYTSRDTGEVRTAYTVWADDVVNLDAKTAARAAEVEARAA